MFTLIVIALIFLVVMTLLAGKMGAFYIVHTREAAIIERLGKFTRVAGPGLNVKIPLVDIVRARVNLQVQQLNVEVETKTKDNVFVTIPVAVQYQVLDGHASNAYYSMTNPQQQIVSYVQDNVRTSLAKMSLDESFESKDDIAAHVETTLSERMNGYGWAIVNTLITDITPAPQVRESMNAINAAQRQREAAIALAEAEKIRMVKAAEGEAEAKRLQGEGIANERKAIVEGLSEQLQMLKDAGVESSPEELLVLTQYFDTIKDVAKYAKSNVLMLPSNPAGVGNTTDEIRNIFFGGKALES